MQPVSAVEVVKAGNRPEPHSVEAEQALLGGLMLNNRMLDVLEGNLSPEQFYIPLHGAVFAAMLDVYLRRGREANPVSVGQQLRSSEFGGEEGLFPHLSVMFERGALSRDIRGLAEVIRTAFVQRKLAEAGERIRRDALSGSDKDGVKTLIEHSANEVFKLTEAFGAGGKVKGLRECLLRVLSDAEEAKRAGTGMTGVTTGFHDLDRLLGGMHRSDLIILGARPSMGKTSLMLNIALNAARRGYEGGPNGAGVAVFSLEMSAQQLTERLLSSEAGVSTYQLANGKFEEGQFIRVTAAANELAEVPLYIDDTPALSIRAMRSRARQLKRRFGIGLILVDYLQLMTAPGAKGDQNRVQEISQISQGLKQIARELDVPVIAASQLSRQLEQRENKRPQLSDLRESGSIEQDADLVWFLYREEYYLSKQIGAGDESLASTDAERNRIIQAKEHLERVRGITELLVSKNRKGPTDTIRLLFHGATTTFHNFSGHQHGLGG